MELFGMQVIESTYAVSRRQFRKPRCKSKRIHKKWAKDETNFKTTPACFMAMGKYIVHPAVMADLMRGTAKVARGQGLI